jgi:hypothetical protein
MRIGMIFECGPVGADKQVCEYLAKRLKPDLEIISVTLNNKQKLIENCGITAKQLLETEQCEKVIIIWDLHPSWRDTQPCRKEDCETIKQNLSVYGIDSKKFALVCIEEELEAWLIADGQAISSVLRRPPHPAPRIDDEKKPDRFPKPKTYLGNLFRRNIGRPYTDYQDAIRIAQRIENFKCLRRSDSFARFAKKVADIDDLSKL